MRIELLITLFAASSSFVTGNVFRGSFGPAIEIGLNRAFSGRRPRPVNNNNNNNLSQLKKDLEGVKTDLRGGGRAAAGSGGVAVDGPPGILKWAYGACGLATTAAWTTIVLTTIRDNQPLGAMMPCPQHPFVNRVSVLSAVPLVLASVATLRNAASSDSWEEMNSPSARRHNLALVAAGVSSALFVGFAPLITKIPGTTPLASHQAYSGGMRAALVGAYASTAALSAAVWAKSVCNNKDILKWPGQVADGVCQSLVSLAPIDTSDPVQVKYSLLASGLLFFTGLQLLGPHPLAVIPSWTGRRLSRAFPAWTFLAAVTAFDLKEATEKGVLLTNKNYRTLSNGLKTFGAVHLASKVGAIFFDPSFPESYHAVQMVPGWATAAIVLVSLTLRSDGQIVEQSK